MMYRGLIARVPIFHHRSAGPPRVRLGVGHFDASSSLHHHQVAPTLRGFDMNALLVAYDIPDDGRRGRVAKELVKLGRRVQYSVFLVRDVAPRHVSGLVTPLLALADDDVRIHPLCAACEAKAILLGRAGGGAAPVGFRVI